MWKSRFVSVYITNKIKSYPSTLWKPSLKFLVIVSERTTIRKGNQAILKTTVNVMMYCAACKNFPMLMRPCRMPTPTFDMLLLDRFLLCCLIVIRPLRTVPSVLESFLCRTITGEDPRLPFQKLCVFGSVRTVRSRFFTPMLGFCPTLDLSAAIFTLRPVYWFLLARTSISFRYSNGALLILVNSNTALSSKGANKR